MIPLMFVADGDLDEAVLPALVAGLLGRPVHPQFRRWARLHEASKGYSKKLVFATLQARDAGSAGLVATVDQDKDRAESRIRALREGRQQARASHPPFPTALGQAIPHAEAWLLDDVKAVREGLGLSTELEVPGVRKETAPKQALEKLWRSSPARDRSCTDAWREIARRVDLERCVHSRDTGLHSFAKDLLSELRELTG